MIGAESVAAMGRNPQADSQFKTLNELIDYIKANPGKLKIGGSQSGGFHDAIMNKFSRTVGGKMTWVAYEGGKDAALALLGGHIDATHMTPSSALAQVMEGKIRVLGVASDKRLSYLPDAPTYKEQGVDMEEWLWRGVLIKKGTPPEIVKLLHDTFKKVMDTPEWKDYIDKNKQTEVYLGTSDFNKVVAKESEEAAEYLKEIGVIK